VTHANARLEDGGLAFLGTDGEMARLIARHDWSGTLGPIPSWSPELRCLVGMVLRSPLPMVLMWGPQGTMIYNEGYAAICGARHPAALGAGVVPTWPEAADFNRNVLAVGLAGGSLSYKGERMTLYRSEAPEEVWLDLDYTPVVDGAGRPAGVLAILTETTERVLDEDALRASENRLRFLDALGKAVAGSQDADAVLATTTRMVGEYLGISVCAYADMDDDEDGFTIRGDWAAPGSTSIVGHYKLADFGRLAVSQLGAGLPLIINDNLKEIAPEEAATFQNIGIAATICMPLVKEGRLTALMAIHHKAPHRWTPEELAVIREVTERSWAHVERVGAVAELRASEERFRTLAKALPNHVWTASPDGRLDWFNEQVYAFSGMEPGTLDGEGWARLVHPDDLLASLARWSQALTTGETYDNEFRLRRADGVWRWHLARAVPVKDATGNVTRWIGANTEIQGHKEVAQALTDLNATLEERVQDRTRQLLQAEEALRQSQKMEAVGQLTGGIAHDFNNLLAGIIGNLELLDRRMAQGQTTGLGRYIDAAQGASRRAAALTQRLLAFSRRQTLDPKAIDANRLIAGMEDLIGRSVGPTIQIEVQAAPDLWTTRVDPSQLENSLLNLCINARDAMTPQGGRLRIETENSVLSPSAGAKLGLPAGEYVLLCVIDEGTGMTPDVIDRAFDPFFTTKPLGAGTGLGLSMVYGFVRQSGGQVRIQSEAGAGTTVCLYLPRHAGDAENDHVSAKLTPGDTGRGETVLVVDDEAVVRSLIVDVLEEDGYVTLEAEDGLGAMEVLQSAARIDLLVTDVGLPGGINGRQVADAARVLRPALKVLFVTGYAENAAIGDGDLAPGMEVLTKPFNTSALGGKVRDLMDRSA
jgi:PAS domain S-box-containing protein